MTVHDLLVPQGKLWFVIKPGEQPTIFDDEAKAKAAAKDIEGVEIKEGVSFKIELPAFGIAVSKEAAEDDLFLAETVARELGSIVGAILRDAQQNAGPKLVVARPNDIPPELPPRGPGGLKIVPR